MALFIVLIILLASFGIEQYKAGQWRREQLKKDPGPCDTYTDYFGMDRDRKTDAIRFTALDMNGDRVLQDKHFKTIRNLSKEKEIEQFNAATPKAIEMGLRAVELELLPSDKKKYLSQFHLRKKYKDIYTKADYIIIKGNRNRGMDLVHYYYDYQSQKVVCPADGFEKRFNDPCAPKVRNTKSFRPEFPENVCWDDVLAEIPKLQEDIDDHGLSMWQVVAQESDYGTYIHDGGYYAR
ncbi:hypothetical protein [Butyrivibrio sp. INlla21]|uniref:hypothetical protein n=1 Tax=Butyrivibrio sp. INlla21 TaxID=1520811 RepID=UPI0008DF1858|nr:hypothetical protein [Butyrivibrio sp. INlla21]SFU56938.1 hypothetical protein SAMN02910342_00917 [Butyrivibrio sp. INlla21]